MQEKQFVHKSSIFKQIRDFFLRNFTIGTVQYNIENIRFQGTFYCNDKKLYTRKSCDVIARNSIDPTKEIRYKAYIKQVDVEKLNMTTFYENEDFNRHLEEIRLIRHINITSSPIVFHNEYMLPVNLVATQRVFFVYKDYDGTRLGDILECEENFYQDNPISALKLLQHVGEGLLYLHQKGMVHGDVNPDNIILCTDGNYKLADTCYLHILSHLRPQNKIRELKSLNYCSPDAITTSKVVTKEEDVWAYGVIIYNLYFKRSSYYFNKLNPYYQIEPELCLLHMFQNFGPFITNKNNNMPTIFYTLCAGAIWRPIIDRAKMQTIMMILRQTEYNPMTKEFICKENELYKEIYHRIPKDDDNTVDYYRCVLLNHYKKVFGDPKKMEKWGKDSKYGYDYESIGKKAIVPGKKATAPGNKDKLVKNKEEKKEETEKNNKADVKNVTKTEATKEGN
uniref:Protein kinase domain-containing protein n=1 Tax=Parastrongyloides trichosuri TaxID=131310 RepID=A0A0N4ZYT7_PARTI